MTTVEILKEMAFTATETQRRALEDAISVLSAKGDLISRQAVLDGIDKYIEKAQSTGTIDDFNSFAELVIKTLPSVENKGEWLHPYRSDIACECSVCHIQMPITDYFHYCPNCGADMRGEKHE